MIRGKKFAGQPQVSGFIPTWACVFYNILSQYGFHSDHSTIDMIFSLRQVMEKVCEKKKELFMVFVDLTKAFDTINRQALW